MEKLAPTDYPLHDLIARRWSPYVFDGRPIPPEQLAALFEAARWAPSSYNEQPWCYIIATRDQPAEFDKLASCLLEANALWAKNAYLLICAVTALNFSRNGKPNRHAQHDLGLANENLVLQAESMGLAAHQMAGFLPDKARETYAIPAGYEPLTMIAVGHPGSAASIPQALQEREQAARSRKPLAGMVYRGNWGQSALLNS